MIRWLHTCVYCGVITISQVNICPHTYYKCFSLWWRLLRFTLLVAFKLATQCINYGHHAVSLHLQDWQLGRFGPLCQLGHTQPSPLGTASLLSVSMSLVTVLRLSVLGASELRWYLPFSVWPTSFIPHLTYPHCHKWSDHIHFLWVNNILLYMYLPYFWIHSTIDGNLGYFHNHIITILLLIMLQ